MENITFGQFMGLCGVVLVLVGAYNVIITAVRNHREEKKLRNSPITQLTERVDKHDVLLAKDKDRLDEHDEQLRNMSTQSTIILKGVRALLSHEINGNSVDKLQTSANEIDDYLIDRK